MLSVCTLPSRLTTCMPDVTRPKMVCFPSSQGVGASVTKNCGVGRRTGGGWGAGLGGARQEWSRCAWVGGQVVQRTGCVWAEE